MKPEIKKALVTGATGFIGQALSRLLLAGGAKVYGVGRNRALLEQLRGAGDFVPVEADFADYGRLDELAGDAGFDMFWHLAWQGTSTSASAYGVPAIQVENVRAACDAALAAARMGARACAIAGSFYQFCRAGACVNPAVYGACKQGAAELFKSVAHAAGMPCQCVIFPNVFGAGDKPAASVRFFAKKMLAGEPLNLVEGGHTDDWIDVEDLAEGMLAAAARGSDYADYYVGHRNPGTFREKLIAMKGIIGSESELLFGTYPESYRVDFSLIDTEALWRDTGWEPRISFERSVRCLAEWLGGMGDA